MFFCTWRYHGILVDIRYDPVRCFRSHRGHCGCLFDAPHERLTAKPSQGVPRWALLWFGYKIGRNVAEMAEFMFCFARFLRKGCQWLLASSQFGETWTGWMLSYHKVVRLIDFNMMYQDASNGWSFFFYFEDEMLNCHVSSGVASVIPSREVRFRLKRLYHALPFPRKGATFQMPAPVILKFQWFFNSWGVLYRENHVSPGSPPSNLAKFSGRPWQRPCRCWNLKWIGLSSWWRPTWRRQNPWITMAGWRSVVVMRIVHWSSLMIEDVLWENLKKPKICATPIFYQPAQNRHDWLSWTSPSGCWWHHPQTWLSWLVTGSRLGTWCHEPLREPWRWGLPSEETWGYTIRGDDYSWLYGNTCEYCWLGSNVFKCIVNILGILTIQDNPRPGLFCHEKDIQLK